MRRADIVLDRYQARAGSVYTRDVHRVEMTTVQAFRTTISPIYSQMASYLTSWEELPVIEFLSRVIHGEDGKRIILKPKPFRSLAWTHRYTIHGSSGVSHARALRILRSNMDSMSENPESEFVRPGSNLYEIHQSESLLRSELSLLAYNLQMILIQSYAENQPLCEWYISLLDVGEKASSLLSHVRDEAKKLRDVEDMDRYIFHIRNRNSKAFEGVSSSIIRDDDMWGTCGSEDSYVPLSLMSYILLDGWKAKYYIARGLTPAAAVHLLPSLFWEAKFDEIEWLAKQRVPYTPKDMEEFTVFGVPEGDLRSIIGDDRPLLCLPMENSVLGPDTESKGSTKDTIKYAADMLVRTGWPRAHESPSQPVLGAVNVTSSYRIMQFFASGQMFLASDPSMVNSDMLRNIVNARNDMAPRLASLARFEKDLFRECCIVTKDDGYSSRLINGQVYDRKGMEDVAKKIRSKASERIWAGFKETGY